MAGSIRAKAARKDGASVLHTHLRKIFDGIATSEALDFPEERPLSAPLLEPLLLLLLAPATTSATDSHQRRSKAAQSSCGNLRRDWRGVAGSEVTWDLARGDSSGEVREAEALDTAPTLLSSCIKRARTSLSATPASAKCPCSGDGTGGGGRLRGRQRVDRSAAGGVKRAAVLSSPSVPHDENWITPSGTGASICTATLWRTGASICTATLWRTGASTWTATL